MSRPEPLTLTAEDAVMLGVTEQLRAPLPIIHDPRDADLVQDGPWYLMANGYPSRRRNGKLQYLHRLIAGDRAGYEVDHRNGDKLDVRRANLRHVLHVHNIQNQTRLRKDNRSGFRGVALCSHGSRWRAYATVAGRRFHLGHFDAPEQAAEAARAFRLSRMEGATS